MGARSSPMPFNFGELATDEQFTKQIRNLDESVDKVGTSLQAICSSDSYSKLSTPDKIKYDLFVAYSLNSLYWMYLRTKGIDPVEKGVKNELDRVRACMTRSQRVHDRKNIMPHLDKDAAKRFVRSGLWAPTKPSTDLSGVQGTGPPHIPQPKKKRFPENISAASGSPEVQYSHTVSKTGNSISTAIPSKKVRKRQREANTVGKSAEIDTEKERGIHFKQLAKGKQGDDLQTLQIKKKKNRAKRQKMGGVDEMASAHTDKMTDANKTELPHMKRKKNKRRANITEVEDKANAVLPDNATEGKVSKKKKGFIVLSSPQSVKKGKKKKKSK